MQGYRDSRVFKTMSDLGDSIENRHAVPEWLVDKYMEGVLKTFLKNPELQVTHVGIKSGTKEGDNFAGQVLRINVTIKDHDDVREMSLIAKIKPASRTVSVMEELVDVFAVETSFYTILLPLLQEELKGLTLIQNFTPECYYVDRINQIMFLEDLQLRQFKMYERHQYCGLEETLLVVRALAALHGGSINVIQKKPEIVNIFKNIFLGREDNVMMVKWAAFAEICINNLVDSFGLSEELNLRLRGFAERHKWEGFRICRFQEDSLNVICHGDLWKNNVMFHSTNGKVDDVVLLDYQVTQYNCFANDLNYFLFLSSEADVIANHLDTILKAYHEVLTTVARDISDLSFNSIREGFYSRIELGLICAVVFRAFVYQAEPFDIEAMMDGKIDDRGFRHPNYVADLHLLLPFFKNIGIL